MAVLELIQETKPHRFSFERIRTRRVEKAAGPSAALIPLFFCVLLYMSGIVGARFWYLRPGYLLISLPLAAVVALAAVRGALRLRWLPLALIWVVLGWWSAETEREPAASREIAALSDGLLRTVEGRVTSVGPVKDRESEESEERANGEGLNGEGLGGEGVIEGQSGERLQRVDLQITAAEVVNDDFDRMVGIAPSAGGSLRLSVIWPRGGEGSEAESSPGGIGRRSRFPAGMTARNAKTTPKTTADPRPAAKDDNQSAVGNDNQSAAKGDDQNTRAAYEAIGCGQRIRVVVRMLPPVVYHDAGVWNRAAYLEEQDVSATGLVNAGKRDTGEARVRILEGGNQRSFACLVNRWRNLANARLEALPVLTRGMPAPLRASGEDAAMLAALLTGDRSWLTRGLRVGFERTGSFHLIVVSGLHLAILAGCVFYLTKRLRLGRLPATLITLAVTLAYAVFTGFAVPAQRSFWMIALYLAGRVVFRGRSPLNVIGFAAICLAAVSPRSIFDASLQMTLISVTAIAGIAIPLLDGNLHAWSKATVDLRLTSLDSRLPAGLAQFRVTLRMIARHCEPVVGKRVAWRYMPLAIRSGLRLGELLFVTLVVEMALALPMAVYFHRITVYAMPVNLLILPLLGILVPAAMGTLLVAAVWPALAFVPGAVCLGVLHVSVFVVRQLGAFSFGDLRVPEPSAMQAGFAMVLFVLAVLLARGLVWGVRSRQQGLALLALGLMAAAALWPRAVDHPRNALLFEAIDVGQGDSLLLITPDGKTVLVDGGGIGFGGGAGSGGKSGGSEFDVGEEVVSAVLWGRGIRRLDVVALTHGHHDHMGGLPAVLRNFRPRELWVGNNPRVAEYVDLLDEAGLLGVRVRNLRAGDEVGLGLADFRVLAPSVEYRPGKQPKNDDSLVMRASFGETSILLTGDAEGPEERGMLEREGAGQGFQSSVLKVGHHGSLTSTKLEFLGRVRPAWAVISCGRRNKFGHPRGEILEELQGAGVRTFRTDLDGASCLLLDGKSVVAEPMCAGLE